MQSLQSDPLLPFAQNRQTTLKTAWTMVRTHARFGRLIREEEGVRGPLWFGSEPSSPYHTLANILRIICAILLAPTWMWMRPRNREWFKNAYLRHFFWSHELPQSPQTIFAGPGSSDGTGARWGTEMKQVEYSVENLAPKWLLEVQFRDDVVVAQRQVSYDHVKRRIDETGYTAIGYAMKSAEHLFAESGSSLDPQPQYSSNYSLKNRRLISQSVLDEYAIARTSSSSDGLEYIWLEDFCLADERVTIEADAEVERSMELGKVADIFRSARRVVVFCHVNDCDHTNLNCPWANRLFTLAEIMHAQRILQMTRVTDEHNSFDTVLTSIAGQDFRTAMMSNAAKAKMWDLYNVMQHSTNSGGIPWQTAIHSLVLDILRREEADNVTSHNLVAKALNGLLPRRAQLADLHGVNGWADLSLLLELNQGFYNSAALAAICKLPDAEVNDYRWLGKPILPKEGTERLDLLVTANPVRFRDESNNSSIPVLSFTGPQIIDVDHMLQRDSGALERQPEMEALCFWALVGWCLFTFLGIILLVVIGGPGVLIVWLASILYVGLQLTVGTIYVEKDKWVVVEDWKVPKHDAYCFLQARDPTYTRRIEWDYAKWDVGHMMEPRTNSTTANSYPATLIDLSTGVFVKTLISTRPTAMVVLAAHGSGITCMLLDREPNRNMDTISVKAGMINIPPRALSQANRVGNVYVGGRPFKQDKIRIPFFAWVRATLSGGVIVDGTKKSGNISHTRKGVVDDLEMRGVPLKGDHSLSLQHTYSVSSTTPIVNTKNSPYRLNTGSSCATTVATEMSVKGTEGMETDISLPRVHRAQLYY
ncbi:hypothetical protein Agabi119p4_8639 [Agaricus bisporus var. burnettii]|uniref:Heterokaryon incompatibility domain-containing protein n=1 Tax=Agaricus bisporus var. burnettii TaxID=192524 RepID=A0A8H7C470_AGABI|nr:hypothetical protein Agabi119p4_8639 [Agaricus bisporus var. burnettii]